MVDNRWLHCLLLVQYLSTRGPPQGVHRYWWHHQFYSCCLGGNRNTCFQVVVCSFISLLPNNTRGSTIQQNPNRLKHTKKGFGIRTVITGHADIHVTSDFECATCKTPTQSFSDSQSRLLEREEEMLLRCFQQLRLYRNELETRDWE